MPVEAFAEKPDKATAETCVASGDYAWNAGMLLSRMSVADSRAEPVIAASQARENLSRV